MNMTSMACCTVVFRGQDRDVSFAVAVERDGKLRIDWVFKGLTSDEHYALQISDEETASIDNQIIEHARHGR